MHRGDDDHVGPEIGIPNKKMYRERAEWRVFRHKNVK